MRQCERCGKKFANVLDALNHQQNFQHKYVKMDPEKKAAIVKKVEANLGLEHFIVPKPIVVVTEDDIPPAFCLPGENVCVWEKHGLDLCAPCAVRKAHLLNAGVAV